MPDTATQPRCFLLHTDRELFVLSYQPDDFCKAIRSVCRWREQGLITDREMHFLAKTVMDAAREDGAVERMVKRYAEPERPRSFVAKCVEKFRTILWGENE